MDTLANATLHPAALAPLGWGRVVRSLVAATANGARWLARPAGPQGPGADELRAMSDRDLKDLGIGRSEVAHVLRGDLDRP